MDKLFQNKWAIRVMALIFAVSLYLYVGIEEGSSSKNDSPVIPSPAASSEMQVLDDVPLDVKIEDDYVVSGVPENVSVSLEGKPRVLTPIVRQRNFKIFVDLRELPEGEHSIDVEYDSIPEDLKVYIEPKSIDVLIEKRSSREFSVNVDIVNMDKLPLGYEVLEPEVTPEKVTIVSSEDIIDQIAMVKVFIDVTDLKESINNREMRVSVYDVQGNDLNARVEPENVAVTVPVERPSKTVPLAVKTKGELSKGLSIKQIEAQKEIEIFGKREILSNIESISTTEIDLSKVEKSGEYEADIAFPDGVTANEKQVPVDIDLQEERTFKDIKLEVEGVNKENFTFEKPDTGKINIIATGSDNQVSSLKVTDLKASIQLDELDKGNHDVKVIIEGPEGLTFESDPKKVTIHID